jgi:hypothetical protein
MKRSNNYLWKSLMVLASALALSANLAATGATVTSSSDAKVLEKARVGSGFGFTVNGFRNYDVTEQTQWYVDGELQPTMPNVDQFGKGMRVNVTINDAQTEAAEDGQAQVVMIESALRGPITQAASAAAALRVLGQPITVNANTVFVNVPGNTVSNLTVGQLLGVFGHIDSNNSFVATRLELRQNALVWRITGFSTAAAASTVTIGNQTVSTTGLVLENCANPIPAAQYMEVRADAQANFAAGQTLTTANRIRCGTPFAPGAIGSPGVADGLISSVESDTQFKMSNLTINHGATTLFRNGTVEDIDVGVRVEVEGLFSAANTIDAKKIRFIYPQVRFEAPVTTADIVNGVSIKVLGNTLKLTPQTRDEDGVGANGVTATTQVRVRGYVDIAGMLFATRIENRGTPRPNRFRAMGPANTIAAPNFKIFGLNINTATSTFVDAQENPITAAQFFAGLSVGRAASIEDATFDAATNTLTGGTVGFEDDVLPTSINRQKSFAVSTISGVISGAPSEEVLVNGFE